MGGNAQMVQVRCRTQLVRAPATADMRQAGGAIAGLEQHESTVFRFFPRLCPRQRLRASLKGQPAGKRLFFATFTEVFMFRQAETRFERAKECCGGSRNDRRLITGKG